MMLKELPAQPGFLLQGGFIIIAILLVAMFAYVLKSRRFLVAGFIWLAFTGILAATGVLSDFSSTPPKVVLLLFPAFAATLILGSTKLGERLSLLPLTFLVGYQAFRIPVEILIHHAAQEGVAPLQMSWDGLNLDILSGVSALLLFPFVKRMPRWSILLWNILALCLLLWIVGVAILSMPSAFQQLEPDNIWVAHFPFIWLPTVAVTFALIGHVAVFRKLRGVTRRRNIQNGD